MQAWCTLEGYDVGCLNQRRKLEGMRHYKYRKPTGEELHSRAVWQKGSFIGFIAHKTGKDRSSVCHKVEKTERYKRFSGCVAQKEGSCPPTAGKGRKGGTQTLRSLIVRGALIPQADRLYLRLEYGVSCVVEPLDYSAVRPRPPPSSCQVCHHLRRKEKRVRSKRPKTQGKIEISHSVKDRPKQADVGSLLGD